MKQLILTLGTVLWLFAANAVSAQGNKNHKADKEAWKQERKEAKEHWKEQKRDRKDEQKERKRDDKEDRKEWKRESKEARRTGNGTGFPRVPGSYPRNTPRQLAGVPKGHYPPPGMCRLWYPGRPPGQQRPPQPCGELQRLSFGEGAFILYNEKAYDLEYDWRRREAERPRSVPGDILGFYRNRD